MKLAHKFRNLVLEVPLNVIDRAIFIFQTFPPTPSHVELVQRDEPIIIKRVSSVFQSNSATNGSGDDKRDFVQSEQQQIVLTSTEGFEYPKEKVNRVQSG